MTDWVEITTMQDEHPRHINVRTGEVAQGGLGGAGTFADHHRVAPGPAVASHRLSCAQCGAPAIADLCGYCGTPNA